MIPRLLHRVVLPPMTAASAQPRLYWEGLRELHPTWSLRTWTSASPADWPEVGSLLRTCRSAAQRADLIRLEVLWRHGGVYVDTDCEGIRSLDRLIDDPNGFFIGAEADGMLANTVLGATAQHPAVRAYLDAVLQGFDRKAAPNVSTGPHLATRVLADRSDVTVHPPVTFFCEPPNSDPLELRPTREELAMRYPEAVLVHRWAHSWRPKPSFSERLRSTTVRTLARVRRA